MNRIKRICTIGCVAISAAALVWLLVFVSGFGTVAVAAPQVDVAQADLVITKTVSPATDVTLAIDVLYTVEIANHGDATATGVVISDTLPPEVEFGGWVDQGSAMPPGPMGDTITWGPYDVAMGQSHSFAFTATLKGFTALLPVTNEACFKHDAGTNWACDSAAFKMAGYDIHLPLAMRGVVQTGTVKVPPGR